MTTIPQTWHPDFSRNGRLMNPLPRKNWLISGGSTLDREKAATDASTDRGERETCGSCKR